jgi:hypothetical protein
LNSLSLELITLLLACFLVVQVNRSNSLGSIKDGLSAADYCKQIRHSLYVDQTPTAAGGTATSGSSVYQCKGYAPLVFRSLREVVGVSNQSFVVGTRNVRAEYPLLLLRMLCSRAPLSALARSGAFIPSLTHWDWCVALLNLVES